MLAWAGWVCGDPCLGELLQKRSWRTEVRGWLVCNMGTSEHVHRSRGETRREGQDWSTACSPWQGGMRWREVGCPWRAQGQFQGRGPGPGLAGAHGGRRVSTGCFLTG